MAVPSWVWLVLLVTVVTITIRVFLLKESQTTTNQPLLTTDQIIQQTGFDEKGQTTTSTKTDPVSGAITTTTTDSSGKTMSVTTSKDGSTTQTTVKDKDGTVLADNKTSALDTVKAVAPTLLQNIAAGVARDLAIIGGAKIISKATQQVAELGLKSALQQSGKLASRQGAGLAMKYLGYVTKESAEKAISYAAETGARKAANEAAEKILQDALKKAGKKTLEEVTDVATREAIEEAMKKAGKEAAEKAANEAVEKAAKKVAMTASEKAAAKVGAAAAAKIGAKAGVAAAKMSKNAAMGPVGAALMAFDVLSLALDVAGCGGFQEGPFDNKTWTKTRDTLNGQVKAMVDDSNADGDDPVRWPIITGPFDKLDKATQQSRLLDKVRAAMADPENKYVKDVVAKLKTAIEAKTITDESQIDAFIDQNIDLQGLLLDSTKALCLDLKGKVIMDGDVFAGCSWATQDECEKSFTWPITEKNQDDIYSVWNKEKQECNKDPVSQNMRGICEVEKFPFNKDTKICELNETHCKAKGMKWDGTNCKLDKGQEIAEMMFGTTVVRGLNALYSADQYKPCPAGSRPAGEIAALAVAGCSLATVGAGTAACAALAGTYLGQTMCATDKCPDGQEKQAGLCYPACKKAESPDKNDYDSKADGITGAYVQGMCYRCDKGYKKTTTGMCQREKCPDGQEQGTGLGVGFCYKKCTDLFGPEYTESDGAGICKKPCPPGMVTDPLTCRREPQTKTSASAVKTCPPGWSQTVAGPGGMCQQDCSDGYKKYGGLCYHPSVDTGLLLKGYSYGSCPDGFRTDPLTCQKDARCSTSWNSCAYKIHGCSGGWRHGHCKGWGDICQGRLDTSCSKPETLKRPKSCPAGYSDNGAGCTAVSKPAPQSKPLTEVGKCNDPNKTEAAGGMCYEPCSVFGGSFKRTAVGLCQMDLMVTERTKLRQPAGPFVVAKAADQYSREPTGISYKVFPKERAVPFGKGPNGC